MDRVSLSKWFTPQQARSRSREKARERQRRRRERKKVVESNRPAGSSDEEGFSLDFLEQTDQEHTPGPSGPLEGRREYLACAEKRSRRQLRLGAPTAQCEEDGLTRNSDAGSDTQAPAPEAHSDHNAPEMCSQSTAEDRDLEDLARDFAMIKCSSYVSDAAIEKLFAMFCKNAGVIERLKNSGRITSSYQNTVKPTALKGIPTIFCAINAHKFDEEGNLHKVLEKDLTVLPVEALNTKPPYKKVLWYDCYVRLKEIVNLHIKIHLEKGFSVDHIHNTLKNCSLSTDGVLISKKGRRRFIITSVRFANCIYLWRVISPLIGDPEAKLYAEDLCR